MRKVKEFLVLAMMLCMITIKPVKAAHADLKVSVTADTITISVSHVGKKGIAQVYAFDANVYPNDDGYFGISDEFSDVGDLVGSYTCGANAVFTRPRYDDQGKDRLYQKYYVMQNDKILKGPIYATSITPINHTKATLKQKSIKGLFNENYQTMKYAKDLKVNSITINFNLSGLFNFGKDHRNDEAFVSNGKTYYVNVANQNHYDTLIRNASRNNMNVIAIIAPWATSNRNDYPNALRYNSKISGVTYGTNTSNDKGRDDYIALMEYIASRYSVSKKSGLISTYVISNEIDFTHYFYDCDDIDTYMEEYTRSLRLAHLAIKKYVSDANVAIPFTHYWKGDQRKMGKECPSHSYKPYDLLQWMIRHDVPRGNYDWGIAPHCYAWHSSTVNFAYSDTRKLYRKHFTGNYKTTKVITFSNLEVFDQYLGLKSLRYNGKKRSVYLTEAGVSSGKYSKKNFRKQAMAICQAYYKVANIGIVKSFNYYRLKDEPSEYKGNLTVGLLKKNGQKKTAYQVFKRIDTKQGYKANKKYLKSVTYYYDGKKKWNYKNGKVRSWKKASQIYKTGYQWNKKWKLKNIYRH